MLAGIERGKGDLGSRLRRRADDHRVEIGCLGDEVAPVAIGVVDAVGRQATLARNRDEIERVVTPDDRNMLVLGDLAEADDPDPVIGHEIPQRDEVSDFLVAADGTAD